jgi:lipopolysaccharide transport system ATP-binding protein
VLFVSHSMSAVKGLCDRALLLEGGRRRALGSVDAVVQEYLRIDGDRVGEAEIPDDAPRIGSGDARIRRVALRDDAGRTVGQLGFGQPFRLLLDVDVLRPIARAAVELGISTSDGQRVATLCNLDREGPSFALEPGRWRIEAGVDLTLLPGDYAVDAFVQDLDANLTLDWLEQVLRFAAQNVAVEGNDHYRWGQVRGFVRPDARFDPPKRVGEARS